MKSTEEKVRGYFDRITRQVNKAMMPDVRESYPDYAMEIDETVKNCQDLLDNAFIDHKDDEKKQFNDLNNFAHMMVFLENLLKDSTPGTAFDLDKTNTDAAFRGIRRNLLQRYEVFFPRDDDVTPSTHSH